MYLEQYDCRLSAHSMGSCRCMTDNSGVIKASEVTAARTALEGPQSLSDTCATVLEQPSPQLATKGPVMLVRP